MLESANPANPYTVLVSTRNAHKLVEIRQILGPSFQLLDLSFVPALGEVEETGVTFNENAALKALTASSHFDGWVLADDSGLEVDALGGQVEVRQQDRGLGRLDRAAAAGEQEEDRERGADEARHGRS